jgi:hypothetical protein
MYTEKCKVWDAQEKKWFKPKYPNSKSEDVCEILFSQAGEMFFREVKAGVTSFHLIQDKVEDADRYVPCQYSGVKDNNDRKAYVNDTIKCDNGTGVIVFNAGCYMIQWKDVGATMEPLALNYYGLRRAFEITGNILES